MLSNYINFIKESEWISNINLEIMKIYYNLLYKFFIFIFGILISYVIISLYLTDKAVSKLIDFEAVFFIKIKVIY